MKSRHAAMIAGLLAIAVAGWFFFLRGRGDSPKKVVAAAGTDNDPWGGSRKAGPPPRQDPGERGGDTQILVDDDPAGSLRLEGLVLTAGDEPVAGAIVALSANPPRTTRTEDDGSFAFDKLVGRPYTVVARSTAGVGGPVTTKLTATSDPVVLRLVPAGSVTVLTVDGKQQPVAATVELRGTDTQTAPTTADGKASFATVAPGRYDVMARAPGFAASFAFVAVAAAPVELTVVLVPGAPVAGRVLDAGGVPVGDALVIYSGASDWNIRPDERRDGVRSAADGRFRFEALPAGSVRFVARHPAHAPGSSSIVNLDGATAKDGVEIRLTTGATVRGQVVDGAGAPVAAARVRLGAASRGMIGSEPRQVFSADDGTFTVAGLPRKKLQAVAMSERGSSATVDVDASAGDVSGVTLTVDITGTIAGVVVDRSGEPLAGKQVSAVPDFRSGSFDPAAFRLRGFPQELTDAGGRFELVGLAPGSYLVRASRSSTGRGRGMMGLEGERADTGTKDLRIVLPADGGVKGKVAFADGTVPTPFSVGVGFTTEPVASKDGSFELGDIPPGTYQLLVRGPQIDQKSVTVQIKEGEITDAGNITVGKGRVIAGTVIFDGKPVPGATVLAGRQLFGTGSSNTAPLGAGPPGRSNNRETTTDDAGRFTISGLGPADLAVVAEHPSFGRSPAVRLQRGVGDEQAVMLLLAPFGMLSGRVTDAEGPAAEVIVSAQSVTANANYSVSTGPDGTYRFDRLAPDTYKVSALLGTPMRGLAFHSKQTVVNPGAEARVDLTVEKGAVKLKVSAKARAGEFRGGFAWLADGVIAATTGRELGLRLAGQAGGLSTLAIMLGGLPATFEDLDAGVYTVCVTALPKEAAGPQAMTYLERHGDDLPAVCKPVTLAAAPAEQAVEVTVDIPAYVAD